MRECNPRLWKCKVKKQKCEMKATEPEIELWKSQMQQPLREIGL
jgi:hypothetical protein